MQRYRRWRGAAAKVILFLAGVAIALTFPSASPVPMSAREIQIEGGKSQIFALAYVDSGSPAIPSSIIGSKWFAGYEVALASRFNYVEDSVESARERAWIAATYIDSGVLPSKWVSLDIGSGEAANLMTCPSVPQDGESVICIAEKPVFVPATRPLDLLIRRIREMEPIEIPATRGSPIPTFLHGAHGYAVVPPPPGAWQPLMESASPMPSDPGVGLWAGGSLGLAYALAYLDYLGGPIVPPGMRVAATGTVHVSARGEILVGGVIGLATKAESARTAEVDVLFVPRGQSSEVPSHVTAHLAVVEVPTVLDAIRWLCEHGSPSSYCKRYHLLPAISDSVREQMKQLNRATEGIMAANYKKQGRDKGGRFTKTAKAQRVSPVSVVPTKPAADERSVGSTKKVTARGMQQAPSGHMGDGITSLSEYLERVRSVYRAFRQFSRR